MIARLLASFIIAQTCTGPTPLAGGSWTAPTHYELNLGDSTSNFYWAYIVCDSTHLCTDASVPGYTTSNVATDWINTDRTEHPWFQVFSLVGVNDLRVGTTEAVAWGNIKPVYDQALADGRYLVLLTVMPFDQYTSWTPTVQAQLVLYNTDVRNYAADHPAQVTLIDTYVIMGDPLDSMRLNRIYDSGDGLHPNTAGRQFMAQAVQPYML